VRLAAEGLSVAALAVSLLALLGTKLVGLEMVAVFQVAFLSLLSLDDMTPLMDALGGLQYSVGYNRLSSYNPNQRLDPEFIAVEFNESFLQNYNLTFLMVVLPLVAALIFKVLSRVFSSNKERAERMERYFQLSIGEFAFYGFMFSGYLVFLSFTISAIGLGTINDVSGLAMGSGFLMAAVIYQFFLYKLPNFFGEFKVKFYTYSPNSHFYNFLIC
jgi:hypothetical protein